MLSLCARWLKPANNLTIRLLRKWKDSKVSANARTFALRAEVARRTRFSHPAFIALVTIASQHTGPYYYCATASTPEY